RRFRLAQARCRRIWKINRHASDHERSCNHEDDQQYKHYVDERRDVDLGERLVARLVIITLHRVDRDAHQAASSRAPGLCPRRAIFLARAAMDTLSFSEAEPSRTANWL